MVLSGDKTSVVEKVAKALGIDTFFGDLLPEGKAVKVVVLMLGAAGSATLWEAVFADVGVALLAILNAVRIQRMKI